MVVIEAGFGFGFGFGFDFGFIGVTVLVCVFTSDFKFNCTSKLEPELELGEWDGTRPLGVSVPRSWVWERKWALGVGGWELELVGYAYARVEFWP